MSICQDASIRYLYDLGYNPIKLPSEAVDTYYILFRKSKRTVEAIGTLEHFIVEPNLDEFPLVHRDIPAALIEGIYSIKHELGLGLSILNNLLSALAGAGIDLSTKYQNVQKIQFQYKNVLLNQVYRAPLAEYVQTVQPKSDHPFSDYFDEEGEAFIIVDIARSNSFVVEAFDERGASLNLEVEGIRDAIGGKIDVGTAKNSQSKIVYEGDRHISFAFKAIPFWVDKEISPPRIRLSPFDAPVVLRTINSVAQQPALSMPRDVLINTSKNKPLIRIEKRF